MQLSGVERSDDHVCMMIILMIIHDKGVMIMIVIAFSVFVRALCALVA